MFHYLTGLRERGFLVSRGRGRGTAYGLARRLADRLLVAGMGGLDPALEEEGVKLRILALLKQRGRLTNAEIRFISGFSRIQVYRLLKQLEVQGQVRFEGRGRAAHVLGTAAAGGTN